MAKKKIHGLDLLRWVVYVLLALALGVFIYSFAWGFKNAKETALLGLQISADSQTATTKCAEGNMLYGIHNYPFSSVPKEAGAHSKYLDKMPGGNWKCSNICAPSDVNKFADTLSGLTVGGQKMNVVGSRSEFDALVAKSSGKNELLERTMILDVSLQRRGKGCFGPSDDYDNLKGATLAKENTTAKDQRKAEEERQKKAQVVASGGTGSSGRTSRTESQAGTAAGDPSVQQYKAPTARTAKTSKSATEKPAEEEKQTKSESNLLETCRSEVNLFLIDYHFSDKDNELYKGVVRDNYNLLELIDNGDIKEALAKCNEIQKRLPDIKKQLQTNEPNEKTANTRDKWLQNIQVPQPAFQKKYVAWNGGIRANLVGGGRAFLAIDKKQNVFWRARANVSGSPKSIIWRDIIKRVKVNEDGTYEDAGEWILSPRLGNIDTVFGVGQNPDKLSDSMTHRIKYYAK